MTTSQRTFQFSSKEDYIIYLRHLIVSTYTQFKHLNWYIAELKSDIEKRGLFEQPDKLIPEMLYVTHRDKLEHVKSGIVNTLADHSKDAMSYKKFRVEAEKEVRKGLFNLAEISQDIRTHLNDLNIARNWLHHIPESLLIAQIEIAKQQYGDDLYNRMKPFGTVFINNFQYYEAAWLLDLYKSSLHEKSLYLKIHQQMKRDLVTITGEQFRKEVRTVEVRPIKDMGIVKTSMTIQRKEEVDVEELKEYLW